MPKPACVKCQRFLRPKKNGYILLESMPVGSVASPPGTQAPELWKPYKLWRCDLWKCQGCGIEIAAGYAGSPMAEHYQPGFNGLLALAEGTVNDC